MASVRPEQPGDARAIYALHVASFPSPAEARLVDLLRAAGRLSVSLVAEADGVIVGYVAVSPVTAAPGAVGAGLAEYPLSRPLRVRTRPETSVR